MRKNTEAQVSGGVAGGSVEGPVMGLERSSDVVPTEPVGQPGNGEELARAVKPFGIAKRVVWEAYRHVKANRGAAGIDGTGPGADVSSGLLWVSPEQVCLAGGGGDP